MRLVLTPPLTPPPTPPPAPPPAHIHLSQLSCQSGSVSDFRAPALVTCMGGPGGASGGWGGGEELCLLYPSRSVPPFWPPLRPPLASESSSAVPFPQKQACASSVLESVSRVLCRCFFTVAPGMCRQTLYSNEKNEALSDWLVTITFWQLW